MHGAIGERDVSEVAGAFSAEFELAAIGARHAVGYRDVFGRTLVLHAHRWAALGTDGVVIAIDVRVRDPYVAAAVRVDAIGKAIEDGNAVDSDIFASPEADRIVRR